MKTRWICWICWGAWLLLAMAWLAVVAVEWSLWQTRTALGGMTPVCMTDSIRVHEAGKPTGYIIGEIQSGQMVWVQEIDAPFATITYWNGSQWLDGTVPANLLGLCERK